MRNIASERARLGMTQSQLAEKLSVSSITVARWESGSVEPRLSQLRVMADMFGCTVDYLIGRTEERVPR